MKKEYCISCGVAEDLQEHHWLYGIDGEQWKTTLCVTCHQKLHQGHGVGREKGYTFGCVRVKNDNVKHLCNGVKYVKHLCNGVLRIPEPIINLSLNEVILSIQRIISRLKSEIELEGKRNCGGG